MSNNSVENKQVIYVDIDALMDTRLSTLFIIKESLVLDALDNGYFTREEDDFGVVNKKIFRELYDTRDNEVLQKSTYTKVLPFVQDAVRKLLHQALESPHTTEVSVVVNTHPYVLSEKEQTDIKRAMLHYTANLCDVNVVNLSKEELTPRHCLSYSVMIKYEYSDWLEYYAQNEAIKQYPLTKVTLFVPRLYFVRKPSEMEIRRLKVEKLDPFKATEIMFSPFITLKVLPIDIFSVDVGNNDNKIKMT